MDHTNSRIDRRPTRLLPLLRDPSQEVIAHGRTFVQHFVASIAVDTDCRGTNQHAGFRESFASDWQSWRVFKTRLSRICCFTSSVQRESAIDLPAK